MLLSKLITIAIPYSYKWATDAVAGKLALDAVPLPRFLFGAVALTVLYGLLRIADGVDPAGPRRAIRGGRDERGAPARDRSVRAPASTVAALSSRAQDRRPDAGARARPQRHRDDRSDLDADRGSDRRRIRADRRRDADLLRLALRRGDQRHRDRLSGLYDRRHQLAHRHSPFDERERHRRQHQGDRQPAQLRDGQVFRRRRARGGALRQVDGALRADERADLRLAGRAQRRAGGHLHPRPDRRAGDVRRRGEERQRRPSATSCC